MRLLTDFALVGTFALFLASAVQADDAKILINQVGYSANGPKHAVILGSSQDQFTACALNDARDHHKVLDIPVQHPGPVKKWRDWDFWTIDFDSFSIEGTFYLVCTSGDSSVHSYPFLIQRLLLERNTLSDAIYYFKEERSSGRMDQADRQLHFDGKKTGSLDAHGGWWDATGDYGKHLSHLSFSTYFNPQQIPLVIYNLFKGNELLTTRAIPETVRYQDHMLDEAMFGADYLVRVKVPDGSFYRSISTGGTNQVPELRKVAGEMKKFGIYQSSNQAPRDMIEQANNDLEYEVSYRSGGGVAIAALAIASTFPFSGEFKSADYRKAAEDAFDFLEKNNPKLTNDGKENIVDDYCALMAATELYRATRKPVYKTAADRRAASLMARLISNGSYSNYWRADDATRPFFHASDAGLPVVSLLYYQEIAAPDVQQKVRETVKKSLQAQLALNREVNNPFDYARQLTQDKDGNRSTRFFFPHNTEVAPWWQGENARLASLAAAARLAAKQFPDDPEFQKQLRTFAAGQLNWILGLNPFDSSMMNGVGRNNPRYMFFDSWEFTNAPGGISNGITAGFKDEDGIDYNLTYKQTGADNDWRWQEQWLPHGAWYILAVCASDETAKPAH
ncbi:MAG TPA: glycoside hydrolase family 9 protein [Candidatus Eremiobacteraceae bacterium]|nr:glycoside hydrolase family 9 protein [Candidatus Eremiobacteraceae bacterium]